MMIKTEIRDNLVVHPPTHLVGVIVIITHLVSILAKRAETSPLLDLSVTTTR